MKRLFLVLFLVVAASAPAHAWGRGYLPLCDERRVVASIQEKFSYADRKTFHWGVGIDSVTDIREAPEIVINDSLIARRYCHGTAWLSDGRSAEVVYLIESKQGFASLGWRVQSCLPAYDPWHVYGDWCRSIKP